METRIVQFSESIQVAGQTCGKVAPLNLNTDEVIVRRDLFFVGCPGAEKTPEKELG